MKHLRRGLQLFPYFINSGDIKSINDLIKDAFLPNCTFKTAVVDEQVGGHHIVSFFERCINTCPDLVVINSSLKLHSSRVISIEQKVMGTSIQATVGDNKSDKFEGIPHFNEKNHDKKYVNERVKALKLIQQRKLVSFKSHNIVYVTLNEERTHIADFTVLRQNIKVSEC